MTRSRSLVLSSLVLAAGLQMGACSTEDAKPRSLESAATPSSMTRAYATKRFGVPLTVSVPGAFEVEPDEDSSTFLTWLTPAEDKRIRFLMPVVAYRPGASEPSAPPTDYLSYFDKELARFSATFSDRHEVTLDGHGGTLVTARTEWPLSGVIGCPKPDMTADDCFGIRPEAVMRMLVLDVDGRQLLAWASSMSDNPAETDELFADFESMLQSVDFD